MTYGDFAAADHVVKLYIFDWVWDVNIFIFIYFFQIYSVVKIHALWPVYK